MSEEALSRPTSDSRDEWKDYWTTQGETWRTEPEISDERQRELAKRRDTIKPDIEKSTYPFKDIRLSRADVEWLLVTHDNGHWLYSNQQLYNNLAIRKGLDLRGAVLTGVDLSRLPLTQLIGGLQSRDWNESTDSQREEAAIHLETANLNSSDLSRTIFRGAHLEEADLSFANLEDATLFSAHLAGANLRRIYVSGKTFLEQADLGNNKVGFAFLADILWQGANLTLINWSQVLKVGEEVQAQRPKGKDGKRKSILLLAEEYGRAARTYRQLATTLYAQGVNEDANRFAYRAQLCQRRVTRFGGLQSLPAFLGSLLLDMISGYGYRPARSLATYVLVIGVFALIYGFLGQTSHPLSIQESIVVSMTAFHGRGFFATTFSPGDPQAIAAAVEAFVGLFVEVTFIATFTQRFFSR